jgi:hypothetical protein
MPAKPLNAITRIALWFAALLFAAFLFSAWIGRGWPDLFIVRITLMFALPAWLLYLPLLIAYPRPSRRQWAILIVTGFLIGPLSMATWSLVLLSRGETAHSVWAGDPEAGGLAAMMIYAAIVGSLTTIFYLSALRLLENRSARLSPPTS